MMTQQSLFISTTGPFSLSIKVIVAILLSSVLSMWIPPFHLENIGFSVPKQRNSTQSLTEGHVSSSYNNDTHVVKSVVSPEGSVPLRAEVLNFTRPTDDDNTTLNNATFPHTWTPSDEWLHECVERENNNSYNYKERYRSIWPQYQLGDCLKLCKSCASSAQQSEMKEVSIAGHYWRNVCHEKEFSESFNMTFLALLFETFEGNPYPYTNPWPQPARDELVIHLRIGDVIDESKYSGQTSVFEMLRDGADTRHGAHSFYKKGIKSVDEYLTTIRESGLEKVVLRGGSHFPKIYPKSRIYTKCLTEAIQRAGYTTTSVQVDGEDNPDQDFFYMSHAKHFVQATGGYSRLIARMVQRYGGKIVGRVPGGMV